MKKLILVLFTVALFFISSVFQVNAGSGIDGPYIIHKEANQVFTIMDLLSMYEMDVFIENDGYTGYGNMPGEYTVILNQGSLKKEVKIVVVEDWKELQNSNDILFVSDYKNIHVSYNRNLTLYEMIYYIYDVTGYIETDYQFRYEEIIDKYHYSFVEGQIEPGDYEFTFRLTYYSGEQSTYSTVVSAVEVQELPGITIEPPPSVMDQVMSKAPLIIGVVIIVYLISQRKKKRGYN